MRGECRARASSQLCQHRRRDARCGGSWQGPHRTIFRRRRTYSRPSQNIQNRTSASVRSTDGRPRPERVSRIKAKLRGAFADLVEAATQRERWPTPPIDHRAPMVEALLAVATGRLAFIAVPVRRRAVQDELVCAFGRVHRVEWLIEGLSHKEDAIRETGSTHCAGSPASTSTTITCRARSARPPPSAGSRGGTTPTIAGSRSPRGRSATGRRRVAALSRLVENRGAAVVTPAGVAPDPLLPLDAE